MLTNKNIHISLIVLLFFPLISEALIMNTIPLFKMLFLPTLFLVIFPVALLFVIISLVYLRVIKNNYWIVDLKKSFIYGLWSILYNSVLIGGWLYLLFIIDFTIPRYHPPSTVDIFMNTLPLFVVYIGVFTWIVKLSISKIFKTIKLKKFTWKLLIWNLCIFFLMYVYLDILLGTISDL